MAAARANLFVDRDVIARRRDGAGWTKVEAAAAADDFRARMDAEFRGESDIPRLIESADEIARAQRGHQHGSGIAGIGAQIALAQIRGWEQRCAAG